MNYCSQCGSELQPEDTVCRGCGTAVSATPAATAAGDFGTPTSPPPFGSPAPPVSYPPPGSVAPPPGAVSMEGGYPPPPGGYPPPGGVPQPGGYPSPGGFPSAPPPGAYPPGAYPPGAYPPGGGYAPPPGAYSPQGVLADWGPRALGLLIDWAITVVVIIPFIILGAVIGGAITLLTDLAGLAVAIFLAVQVGQNGQSPGMRTIGLKCIGQTTGQPIGAGLGIVRALAHLVDSIICYVGWLFPLWDKSRQTLGDKIMSTVVIRVPPQKFTLMPPES